MTTTDPAGQQYRRACHGCHGEGWVDTGLVDDWPTIAACHECRPVPRARLDAGDYRPDVAHREATPAELAAMDTPGRTALFPWPQMTATAPPGHRLAGPWPKTPLTKETP